MINLDRGAAHALDDGTHRWVVSQGPGRRGHRVNGILHVAENVVGADDAEQRCALQGVADRIAHCCEHQTAVVPDRAVVQLGQRVNGSDINERNRGEIDDDGFERIRGLSNQLLGMLADAVSVGEEPDATTRSMRIPDIVRRRDGGRCRRTLRFRASGPRPLLAAWREIASA